MEKDSEKQYGYSSRVEELSEILPETTFNIELLLEEVSIYDSDHYYKDKVDEAKRLLGDDLTEIVSDLLKEFNKEAEKFTGVEHGHARDKLYAFYDSIREDYPVSAEILRTMFVQLGVLVKPPSKDKKERPKERPYIIAKKLISSGELRSFLLACGLEEDAAGGKGSHEKFTDPDGEMNGFETFTKSSNNIWIGRVVKRLFGRGLPLTRIKKACKKCNISFTMRVGERNIAVNKQKFHRRTDVK